MWLCDNCEKPRVCPDDCAGYQELLAENRSLRELLKTVAYSEG